MKKNNDKPLTRVQIKAQIKAEAKAQIRAQTQSYTIKQKAVNAKRAIKINAKSAKSPKIENIKTILDKFPIRDYQDDYFILDDGSIMNIFQIHGVSYLEASQEEIDGQIYRLAHYYRLQKDPIKILFLNYPSNTTRQQEYLKRKIEKARSEVYHNQLLNELNTLEFLEECRMDKEAFVFIFEENENSYQKQKDLLFTKSSLHIAKIDKAKKLNIVYKLNNMNKEIKV